MKILASLLFCFTMPLFAAETSLYDLKYQGSDGKEHQLSEFKGKVILIANTASHCGFTGQYEDLQSLYKKYNDKGLVVIGFPSTSFNQEFSTDKEVADFCKLKYDVSFPMSRRVEVKGVKQDAVFQYLTARGPKDTQGEVAWNFEKFLINRQGEIKARFRSKVEPNSAELTKELETLLKK